MRGVYGMELTKKERILVYKDGISNNAVKKYLNKYNYKYDDIVKENEYDYIVKPPGVLMNEIKVKGKIICDIELAYMINPFFSIAVTGTNGKTTCVLLINHILKNTYKIDLCGNIGYPIFNVFNNERKIYLLEMSSFELESISTFKPRIAILLNIKEAHLDHHKTMENYINAKANITKNQEKSDFLIYNVDDLNVKKVSNKSHAIKIGISLHDEKAEAYYKEGMMYSKYGNVSFEKTFSDLEGDLYDTMAAVLVGLLSNISIKEIETRMQDFKKPLYRMEEVYPNIYNDSKSTNIYSTLDQIKHLRNISLICGGYDRFNSLSDLNEVAKYTSVFYLYGENKERVANYLYKNQIKHIVCENLEDAILKAIKDYEIILFSPMAPSYDQFKSFEERGKYFNELIKKYLPK